MKKRTMKALENGAGDVGESRGDFGARIGGAAVDRVLSRPPPDVEMKDGLPLMVLRASDPQRAVQIALRAVAANAHEMPSAELNEIEWRVVGWLVRRRNVMLAVDDVGAVVNCEPGDSFATTARS